MRNIAIWGAGNCAKKLWDCLCHVEDIEIIAIADRSEKKIGTLFENKIIQQPSYLLELANNQRIDSIIFAIRNEFLKNATEVFKDCKGLKGYIIQPFLFDNQKYESISECLLEIDLSKPRLKFLQVNIVQHCNLNCKGCANYSNIVSPPEFSDLKSMVADWTQLKKLFWGIEHIKLMGGEPLLHPGIGEFVESCRNIFPDAVIEIGTNGLLINKYMKSLFEVMNKNHCRFGISLYPPLESKIQQLEELLMENNIEYSIFGSKELFFKYLSESPQNTEAEGYLHCMAKGCHSMEQGYLAVCSKPLYIYRLNDRFLTELPEGSGKWNIYNLNIDSWELDRKLREPFECCKYCSSPVYFQWDRADVKQAKKEDWFV